MEYKLIISALHEGYVIIGICLSICLFVNSATQKLMMDFFKFSHIVYLRMLK